MKKMDTFNELCQKEPRLRALYYRARSIRDDKSNPSFCANNFWVNELKPVLLGLVGWEAENPELRTSEAYELSYEVIYEALPDCRNCLCFPRGDAYRIIRTHGKVMA
ncbi:MAG: hypothetical protein ABSF77_05285 [Spirochaetia bacterium]|jgi:hypothetical protein